MILARMLGTYSLNISFWRLESDKVAIKKGAVKDSYLYHFVSSIIQLCLLGGMGVLPPLIIFTVLPLLAMGHLLSFIILMDFNLTSMPFFGKTLGHYFNDPLKKIQDALSLSNSNSDIIVKISDKLNSTILLVLLGLQSLSSPILSVTSFLIMGIFYLKKSGVIPLPILKILDWFDTAILMIAGFFSNNIVATSALIAYIIPRITMHGFISLLAPHEFKIFMYSSLYKAKNNPTIDKAIALEELKERVKRLPAVSHQVKIKEINEYFPDPDSDYLKSKIDAFNILCHSMTIDGKQAIDKSAKSILTFFFMAQDVTNIFMMSCSNPKKIFDIPIAAAPYEVDIGHVAKSFVSIETTVDRKVFKATAKARLLEAFYANKHYFIKKICQNPKFLDNVGTFHENELASMRLFLKNPVYSSENNILPEKVRLYWTERLKIQSPSTEDQIFSQYIAFCLDNFFDGLENKTGNAAELSIKELERIEVLANCILNHYTEEWRKSKKITLAQDFFNILLDTSEYCGDAFAGSLGEKALYIRDKKEYQKNLLKLLANQRRLMTEKIKTTVMAAMAAIPSIIIQLKQLAEKNNDIFQSDNPLDSQHVDSLLNLSLNRLSTDRHVNQNTDLAFFSAFNVNGELETLFNPNLIQLHHSIASYKLLKFITQFDDYYAPKAIFDYIVEIANNEFKSFDDPNNLLLPSIKDWIDSFENEEVSSYLLQNYYDEQGDNGILSFKINEKILLLFLIDCRIIKQTNHSSERAAYPVRSAPNTSTNELLLRRGSLYTPSVNDGRLLVSRPVARHNILKKSF